MSGARVGKSTPVSEKFAEHSHNNPIVATAHGSGAQIVQVETLGKYGLFLLFFCAFVAALSSAGFIFTLYELKTVNARYAALQYDQQALKAQLVAKGIYEATEH